MDEQHVTELEKTIANLKKQLADVSEQLIKTQQKFHHLDHIIASMPGHIYWMNREGRILGCNNEQAKSVGFSSRLDVLGKTIHDFQPKEKADKILANNNTIMRSGKPKVIEEASNLANGKGKIFLSHKAPLEDENENIIGVIGISTDITAHKQKEEQLQKNEFTLENIIALMPGHVYWLDKNNVFVGCNDQQAKTIGLSSRHEIVGKTVRDFQTEVDAKNILSINNEIMRTGISHTVEEKAFLADGSEGYYFSVKRPLYDKEYGIVGLLGVSVDITERKKMEEALKQAKEKAEIANQAKTEFVLNMEHDLRTPSSGIYGLLKILSDTVSDKILKEQLTLITESSEELLNILNDILRFHQIESGDFPILDKSFDLKLLIDKVIKLESASIKEKNIRLNYDFDSHVPKKIIGDEYRTHRILLNLVSNAIKFTNHGSVELSVKLAKTTNPRDIVLKFMIKDTGVGIPKEKQNIIYEKFSKLNLSNTGHYKGLGLGLHIVKQFVEELDGDIEVDSELGKGSTFICVLPFKLPLLLDE